ncbi:hypothetical protein SAMN05216489_08257 [Streptomyces sp. 3213]|nr:hypothetical protein SAMN05216489_08257 [Streptomyces sp. 3213] [Streptomyces sp. 3213.3]
MRVQHWFAPVVARLRTANPYAVDSALAALVLFAAVSPRQPRQPRQHPPIPRRRLPVEPCVQQSPCRVASPR